ncbi:hypothetical protein T05_632 [Trichinella murrelli]|uniref:Uncharacterized protein n=1 Tax=Trichinella murrelli TaxID=144512 RepID=A0A0V0T982_9BILA|nr:hypothetical protein T05_632 [Trichinella murrelli]
MMMMMMEVVVKIKMTNKQFQPNSTPAMSTMKQIQMSEIQNHQHTSKHTHTNSNRATKQPIDNLTTRVGNEKATRRRHQKSRGCANA